MWVSHVGCPSHQAAPVACRLIGKQVFAPFSTESEMYSPEERDTAMVPADGYYFGVGGFAAREVAELLVSRNFNLIRCGLIRGPRDGLSLPPWLPSLVGL
ncbi:hypothetical protein Nepgr_019577 [Nepenthes gracilis]|uniref:Uncharacterized protein n=1 Tax=Nepenthes gracilis TaxID=150966 RepID=A0AAD3SXC2_NEPGR|nr:hypothetical protein Nepgr_019577 [Nepenthes gracilis]